MPLAHYYSHFNRSTPYERTLFLSGRGLQSAEMNELQENHHHRLQSLGDAIFSDGDVIEGTPPIIHHDTGEMIIAASKIYLRGMVREVAEAHITIPMEGSVNVGLYYHEHTVTELEDPSLRDPATGTRNYQEAGAARMKTMVQWGFVAKEHSLTHEGAFYPVYRIEQGVLIQHAPPPQSDAVTKALARYDREANGSYVVSGFAVRYMHTLEGKQHIVIEEGKAHVNGYEIVLAHSMRITLTEDPDIATVTSEPHTFQGDDTGIMQVVMNHSPIQEITHIDITAERHVTLTHGASSGSSDPLPDPTVLAIISVQQGVNSYSEGSDYQLQAGHVDWSLLGNEPAPGSSYEVVYRYRTFIDADQITDTDIIIHGAVDHSLLLVDYQWKMPRIDVITLTQQGEIQTIKGLPHPWRPTMPATPLGHLPLAYIEQRWDGNVEVVNHAIHAVNMQDIELMRTAIANLYDLIAQERLRNNANAMEVAAKRGVFVDPFLDDDMRDQGIAQHAAIVDGELTLPIEATIHDIEDSDNAHMLPYELEPVVEQLLRTSEMKVNPYQAFAPIPAKVTIHANIDRWTELQTTWSSNITRRFSRMSSPLLLTRTIGSGFRTRELSRSSAVHSIGTEVNELQEVLSSTTQEAAFMRQATQQITIEGFEPEETVTLLFDGLEIDMIEE